MKFPIHLDTTSRFCTREQFRPRVLSSIEVIVRSLQPQRLKNNWFVVGQDHTDHFEHGGSEVPIIMMLQSIVWCGYKSTLFTFGVTLLPADWFWPTSELFIWLIIQARANAQCS